VVVEATLKLRYRWAMLILYAISPILVHGTELGRPDHQSLLILIATIAICAEWNLRAEDSAVAAKDRSKWSVVSGVASGLAIWTSAYESLVLFLLVILVSALGSAKALSARFRRAGWVSFVLVIAIAFSIEQRVPSLSIFYSDPLFQNWARTIGELEYVSPANPIWLRWCGYLLFVTPLLVWISVTKAMRSGERTTPAFVLVLLAATYVLTIWQARWGYFFVLIFALVLASLLGSINASTAVWTAFLLSMLPVLRDWDERLWVNDTQFTNRVEKRNESVQLRDLALSLRSSQTRPFLAPWWLSPPIAYWSGQPGVAGSSHESLNGIADSARFFLSDDLEKIRQILANHQTAWVIAYDSERVAQNSAALLNGPVPTHPRCRVLDRTRSGAPPFLVLSAQNPVAKLYRVVAR